MTMSVAPKLLAVFVMLGGAVLMFAGATPSQAGRIAWVNAVVPLAVCHQGRGVVDLACGELPAGGRQSRRQQDSAGGSGR